MDANELPAGRDGDRMIAEKLGWRVIEVEGLWFLVQPAELRENYIRWSMADPSAFKRAGKSNAEAAWKFDRDVIQHYTTSVDAALTLLPKGHPFELVFTEWSPGAGKKGFTWTADIWPFNLDTAGNADTPALAICRAWWKWMEEK